VTKLTNEISRTAYTALRLGNSRTSVHARVRDGKLSKNVIFKKFGLLRPPDLTLTRNNYEMSIERFFRILSKKQKKRSESTKIRSRTTRTVLPKRRKWRKVNFRRRSPETSGLYIYLYTFYATITKRKNTAVRLAHLPTRVLLTLTTNELADELSPVCVPVRNDT